jgi:dTDP-4-dehydrorhamnose 3,5-epimerase
MQVIETPMKDLLVLEPRVWNDARGFFFESYNQDTLQKLGIHYAFVQDNQSFSTRGVLRGLHFQRRPYAQTKLVQTLQGEILDVAVDLRHESSTYGQHYAIHLSSENKKQLLIPQGFAHGFLVLSETAHVLYKCDQFYSQPHDGGIRYDDPDFNIQWELPSDQLIISDKDLRQPSFQDYRAKPLF